jgi:hypothetical protein
MRFERNGPLFMPAGGGEGLGGNTVQTGGPGSTMRAPLYVKLSPSGETATYSLVVDSSGNLYAAAQTKLPQYIEKEFIQYAATIPATGTVMVANEALQLVGGNVRFSHVGGGSAALAIYKDPTGTAPGAGTAMLSAAIDLTGGTIAVNTNYPLALSATLAALQMAVGDGLSLVFSGTLTALTGLMVSLQFQRL